VLLAPSSLRAVLTVAADLTGTLQAEACARELAKRLVPWSAVCNDQVVWHFIDRPLNYVVYLGLAYNSAHDSTPWTLDEYGIDTKALEPTKDQMPLPILVRSALAAWSGWRLGVN